MSEDGTTSSKCHVAISIPGWESTIDGVNVYTSRTYRVEVPYSVTPDSVRRAQKDCEGVAAILRDHPDETAELLSAAAQSNVERSREIATRLGFTEEDFVAKGGGLINALIVAAVVVVLLVQDGHDKASEEEVPLFDDIELPPPTNPA